MIHTQKQDITLERIPHHQQNSSLTSPGALHNTNSQACTQKAVSALTIPDEDLIP